MQWLKLAVSTTLMLGFVGYFGTIIVGGLRTGKIHHTGSTQVCDRRKNPLGYWALVLLFAGFSLLCIVAWYQGFLVYSGKTE